MAMFVSKYFDVGDKLEAYGVFDSLIDEDSNYFINIKLLKNCTIPEFINSYSKVNDYFRKIGMLLSMSETNEDKTYKTAVDLFDFPEVNGINLGFAESKRGAGFGKKLRKRIIADAYEIIKKGSNYPEIFQLVSLFEENVGPDRLSDMIARIIYEDIVAYTKRIMREMEISPQTRTCLQFLNGLVKNPHKDCEILLLPVNVLHELPIARAWDDIDRVAKENQAIKNEINEVVAEQWGQLSAYAKKEYIKKNIFMIPEKCKNIIEAYTETSVPTYDIYQNLQYNSIRIFEKLLSKQINFSCMSKNSEENSYFAAKEILVLFQQWVEYNGGQSIILETASSQREKVCQHLIHLCAKKCITDNNFDFSCEPNAGRGPVDFKISRGNDITVIEVKLSSNSEYIHGLEVQIEEYALAENAKNKIFVFIDIGNPLRLKTIKQVHQKMMDDGLVPADLFIIDAKVKKSASKYKI